jgi:hypothetical protein
LAAKAGHNKLNFNFFRQTIMGKFNYTVCFVLMVLLFGGLVSVKSAKPDPEMIKKNKEYRQEIKSKIGKANKWQKALEVKFSGHCKEDSSLIVLNIFLTTYKHYNPGIHKKDSLDNWAMEFVKTWKEIKQRCITHDLDPVELTKTIYKLTNSDWEPVSCGRNHAARDDITSGEDYTGIADALIELAQRAKKHNIDVYALWHQLAMSVKIGTAEQVRDVDVLNPPGIPKW